MAFTMPHIENIVRAIVVVEGQVLLTRFIKKDGLLGHSFLLGGHIEFGETAQAAFKREMMEEMGVADCELTELVAAQENFYGSPEHPAHEVNLIFLARAAGLHPSRPVQSREGHITFVWCDINKLSEVNFKPECLRTLLPQWLRDHTRGAFVSK